MPPLVDLSGQKFGRLTVLSLDAEKSGTGRKYWNCVCECGQMVSRMGDCMKSGRTKSCGCLHKESAVAVGRSRRRFSSAEKAFRHIWQLMMRRCYNLNDPTYRHYGSRGITVCERWHDYENFKLDMFPRPDGMTLERVNNNKEYSPANCRWASCLDQCNNRRNNNYQTINGITKTIAEWCREYSMPSTAIYQRLRRGWDIENALTTPVRVFQSRSK